MIKDLTEKLFKNGMLEMQNDLHSFYHAANILKSRKLRLINYLARMKNSMKTQDFNRKTQLAFIIIKFAFYNYIFCRKNQKVCENLEQSIISSITNKIKLH